MGAGSWLGRLFRRRRSDWDWGLAGAPKTFRSSDENISNLRPRVTYPSSIPEPPAPILSTAAGTRTATTKVLAEEPVLDGNLEPAMDVHATVSGSAPKETTNGEEWWTAGKVVLGFQHGRVALSSTDPMVKDFIRAADRMMRPRRRLFGKVGAP